MCASSPHCFRSPRLVVTTSPPTSPHHSLYSPSALCSHIPVQLDSSISNDLPALLLHPEMPHHYAFCATHFTLLTISFIPVISSLSPPNSSLTPPFHSTPPPPPVHCPIHRNPSNHGARASSFFLPSNTAALHCVRVHLVSASRRFFFPLPSVISFTSPISLHICIASH